MSELRKDKIAVFIPSYIGGGAEKITDLLFSRLMKYHDYDVTLISLRFNERTLNHAVSEGYDVVNLENKGTDGEERQQEILSAIKETKALHVVYEGLGPIDTEYFRKELPGRNIIFHLHSMIFWEPKVRLLAQKRFVTAYDMPRKYVDWYICKYLKEKFFGVYTHRQVKAYRKLYQNVDKIIVLTETYRREFNKMVNQRSDGGQSKVHAIYNPFMPGDLQCLAGQPKQKEILYIGRFSCIEKGTDNLLRAWKYISNNNPDWKLKLVGEGDDRCLLEYLINALDIPRVEIHGYSTNIAEHLSTASILCLPSNVEGWGMVLLEAMAAGVVPVAFDCSGGVREILSDGRGILVPSGKVKDLGRSIAALINDPDKMRDCLSRHESYLEQFSVERSVDEFIKVLEVR